MLMTIDKTEHQRHADTTMLDRSDEVVVGMIDRVVKACIVYHAPKEQRDGGTIREEQQTSAETVGGEMKTRVCDLWSSTLRWDVQLAGSQPRDRGKIFTRTRAVKDVMLQGAPVNAASVASVRVTFPTMN